MLFQISRHDTQNCPPTCWSVCMWFSLKNFQSCQRKKGKIIIVTHHISKHYHTTISLPQISRAIDILQLLTFKWSFKNQKTKTTAKWLMSMYKWRKKKREYWTFPPQYLQPSLRNVGWQYADPDKKKRKKEKKMNECTLIRRDLMCSSYMNWEKIKNFFLKNWKVKFTWKREEQQSFFFFSTNGNFHISL